MPGLVETRRDGGVAVIVIDNPPVNALNFGVRAGLIDALERAKDDAAVHAVVLACAGRTFIAGADITEFDKPPKPPGASDVIAALEAMPKPVVAALHGTALGGGLEIALGCHYRIAAPSHPARPARNQARPHSRRRRHPTAAAAHRHGQGAADDPDGRADRCQGGAGRRSCRCRRGWRVDRSRGRVCEQARCRQEAAAARPRFRRQTRRSARQSRQIRRTRRGPDETIAWPARAGGGARRPARGHRDADRPRTETRARKIRRAEKRRSVESPAAYFLRRTRGGQDRRPAEGRTAP